MFYNLYIYIYIYISIIFARKRECNFDWEKFTLKII